MKQIMKISKSNIIKWAIVIILIWIVITLFILQKTSVTVSPTETQTWSTALQIDAVTGNVNGWALSMKDYLDGIRKQLNTWFEDNFAEITNIETIPVVDSQWKSLLKDNFSLIKLTVWVTTNNDKIGEFFRLMVEKKNKNGWNIDIDSAMKKFKDSNNYTAITDQIGANLKNVYWDIMTKWFYMVVEDRNGTYIVSRVGEYLNNQYRSNVKIEDQNWLLVFRELVDFLNYGRIYKANDSEVQTVLWVTNKWLTRKTLYTVLLQNAQKNSWFSDFTPLLQWLSDKF